jgi:cytochrome c oxidase cbb3-type subunit 3
LGSKVYAEKCSVCHGVELQGVVGPNLTDKNWLHGKGKLQDIFATIKNGVAEKGMPAWGPLLQDAELKGLVAYISSKKNSQPKNPKAPQGDVFDN